MSLLLGNEKTRIDELIGEIIEASKEIKSYEAKIDDAQDLIKKRSPHGAIAESSLIPAWREKARNLERLHNQLDDQRQKTVAERGELVKAEDILGGGASKENLKKIDSETLKQVEQWIKEAFRYLESRLSLEEQIRIVAPSQKPSTDDIRILARSIEHLRKWLSLLKKTSKTASLILGATAVAGALLAIQINPWFSALSGASFCALFILVFQHFSNQKTRVSLQREFEEPSASYPPSWTDVAVRKHLYSLESDLAKMEVDKEKAIRYDLLAQEYNSVKVKDEKFRRDRKDLAEKLGIDPEAGDLALIDFAHMLLSWRDASMRHEKESVLFDSIRCEYSSRFNEIGGFITEKTGLSPKDCFEVQAMLDDLEHSVRAVDEAQKTLARAKREKEARERDVSKKNIRIDQLINEVGIDPSDRDKAGRELAKRLDRLPMYKKESDERSALMMEISAIETKLGLRHELLEMTPENMESALAESKFLMDQRDGLVAQISGIERDVEAACKGCEIELAMAKRDKAINLLESKREEVLTATAGSWLLASVEEEYVQTSRPELLKKARELFQTFTHSAYDLQVAFNEEEVEFKAVDTRSRDTLKLSELSDGTRLQLLLAARLAFAVFAEKEIKPPIFLDEALTTADPARFKAVMESLILLAESGRQIFYLTCNPSDMDLVRKICQDAGADAPFEIDLMQIRKSASFLDDPFRLAPPAEAIIPSPYGKTTQQYGKALNIPQPDPFAPDDSLHLFYILRYDLDILFKLLKHAWIETVGQYRFLAESGAADSIISKEEAENLDALISLITPFLIAWRIGRGKPATSDTLQRSDAVSSRFIDKFSIILEESGGNAEALMDAIESREDGRVKSFKSQKAEALKEFFLENGYIDTREPLSKEKVLASVLSVPSIQEKIEKKSLLLDEVSMHIHAMWSTFERKVQ